VVPVLSREIMGELALTILWVNVLLIAAATMKQRAALVRLRRGLTAVRRAMVTRGDGPEGAFAASDVKQVGRLGSASVPTIAFHDQDYASTLHGGLLRLEDGSEEELSAGPAAVWVDEGTFRDAGREPSEAAFDAACADAKKARGFARTVRAALPKGRDVFIATLFPGTNTERRLVSALDPEAWLAKKTRLASFFIVSEVLAAGLCTAACLHAPVFGAISTAGGAASLAFFLLVQPVGTLVRDALRTPDRAIRRGTWSGTHPARGQAPEARGVADAWREGTGRR
jgi:hypothetical protein